MNKLDKLLKLLKYKYDKFSKDGETIFAYIPSIKNPLVSIFFKNNEKNPFFKVFLKESGKNLSSHEVKFCKAYIIIKKFLKNKQCPKIQED